MSERKPIGLWGLGQPFPFPGGVDSALNGQGRYSGKAYFFKRDKYARYDWKQDRFDLVDQKLSAWNLRSEEFGSDITGCVEGGEGGLGSSPTAYFFKGDDYVKYDWDKDRGFDGYPFPIAVGWPTGCGVWASHSQAPTNVCPDPRLDGGRTRLAYPSGTIGGQSGWQVLVESRNVKELADKLSTLIIPDFYGDDQAGKGFVPRGRVTRLGMNAHGLAGAFAANGPNAKEDFSQHLTGRNHDRR